VGRPSVQKQRQAETLDAFERCVARYGVDGATLEKISEEAGLARALIRHHVGNREDMLNSMVTRFLNLTQQSTDQYFTSLPENNRLPTLLKTLFDERYTNLHQLRVVNALMVAASERPELANQLKNWVEQFIQLLTREVKRSYPRCKPKQLNAVATGIAGIYFNIDSLCALGDVKTIRKNSQYAVQLLLSTIDSDAK